MTLTSPSARTTTRRTRWLLVPFLMAVIAVTAAVLGHPLTKSFSFSGPSAPSRLSVTSSLSAIPTAPELSAPSPASPAHVLGNEHPGALGGADGVVPAGVTVFDDAAPAVVKLDPDLLKALRHAARDASDDGVEFYVNSGWRSLAYQEQLFSEAVTRYGSEKKAARWVAIPGTSVHESGDAVDLGRSDATSWLSEHGAGYGLCQTYRNEPWHYELRTSAIDGGCPRKYADPTQDPRMQR